MSGREVSQPGSLSQKKKGVFLELRRLAETCIQVYSEIVVGVSFRTKEVGNIALLYFQLAFRRRTGLTTMNVSYGQSA